MPPVCTQDECTAKATYGLVRNRPLYCRTHMKIGMTDVMRKRCRSEGCNTTPSYGFERNIPMYCTAHAEHGTENVVSKRCKHEGCTRQPLYGFETNVPLCCSTHMEKGMTDVVRKRCRYDGCDTTPSYGFERNRPLYCAAHTEEGTVNVVSKRCAREGCETHVTKNRYKGYCLHCFMHMFPDEKIARNYKIKENEVASYIAQQFSSTTVTRDRRIRDGCSSRRPDVLIDLGYQVIIIEVDENQHIEYDQSCENKRLMQLSLDVGHRPIVFVRFNPDDYTSNGVRVTSCFTRNKSGFVVLKKSKQTEWQYRLGVLRDTVQYWTDNVTEKTVEIVRLFYSDT